MDSTTTTDDINQETKSVQENILLNIIKELCNNNDNKLSQNLKRKVNRIVAQCDLAHYSSLHRLSTADASTSSLLGVMNQTNSELSYEEQMELNKAIISQIEVKLPQYLSDLEHLYQSFKDNRSKKDQIKELQDSIDDKLNTLEEQEAEQMELMMEWLNHRLNEVAKFKDSSTELLSLKTKILDLKSKILHLQILQNIFTETNYSIKAYSEVHKDLKDSLKNTEKRIKEFRDIAEGFP